MNSTFKEYFRVIGLNMNPYRWHYSRNELAKHYVNTLVTGAQSLAIFAERRKGKTEFCLYDLMPYAIEQGYRCVYVNFWEDKSNPSACVVNAVVKSLEDELTGFLRGWKKELSVKVGGLQAKISKAADVDPSTANEAFRYLMRMDGPVLLICDEVQHLATNPSFEDFTAALRTFIDSNKDRLRVVFTGSSQDNLNKLFKKQKAAFYQSASLTPFPDMGEGFAQYLSELFRSLTGRDIDSSEIMSVYSANHYSPAFIVELLQVMVRDGFYDMKSGLEYYYQLNPLNQEHDLSWSELSAIDKEILKLLACSDDAQLYSPDTFVLFSEAIGVKVKKSTVQAALKRLRESGVLLNVGRGQWEYENSAFKDYVSTM